MRILYIGGPGNISGSAIQASAEEGHRLWVLTGSARSGHGLMSSVRFLQGNRNVAEELRAAVAEAKPDVVVDTICFSPAQAKATIEACRGKTGRVVFVSTVDVYGYPLSHIPMGEGDKRRLPVSAYAADKAEYELRFQEAATEGAFGLTIARPAYSFGRNFVLDFFSRSGGPNLVARLRKGLPLVVPRGWGGIHARLLGVEHRADASGPGNRPE